MNNKASLGGTMRDRRLALGYSLGQLATKVNKTAASIRSWERGDTVPTEPETAALSDALDLDADLLLSLRRIALDEVPSAEEPAATEPAADLDEVEAQADQAEEAPAVEPMPPVVAEDVPEPAPAAADDTVAEAVDDAHDVSEVIADEVDEAESPEDEIREHPDIDSGTEGGEALVDTVAALATADFAEEEVPVDEPEGARGEPHTIQPPLAPVPAGVTTKRAMHEAMTEAVPVVPAGAGAVGPASGAPDTTAVVAAPHGPPRSANPVVQAWDNVVATYRRIFDPRRKWIYRVRWVLLLIALYIMLRILVWAGSELWDAIGEVLDGIAFTPSETPDVSN